MHDLANAPFIEQAFSTAYRTKMDNIVVVLANTVICIISIGLSCITVIGDQGLGAGDALKKSRELVHSRFWEFVALIILSGIIWGISSLVPLAVIIGMPFSTLLISSYYDQLTKTDQSEEPPIEKNPAEEHSTEDGTVQDSDFSV